jgi:hypothetical protein
LTCLESLACEFNRLTIASETLKTVTPEELNQLCKNLSDRLTYLLEPIHLIESDTALMVVQMRSAPPQRDVGETKYFEVTVARGELQLGRYSKQSGRERRLIPVQITREALLKLIGDVESALHDLTRKRGGRQCSSR